VNPKGENIMRRTAQPLTTTV